MFAATSQNGAPQARTYVDFKGDNIALMPPPMSTPQPGNDPNLRTCRVNTNVKCTSVQGHLNQWDLINSDIPQYSDYKAINHGVIDYKPFAGLRTPQRRDFLEPQYYNSGCTSPFCLTGFDCPSGETTGISPSEKILFDNMFTSWDLDIGNKGSRSCVGIKRGTANSYEGWQTNSSGVPIWQANARVLPSCSSSMNNH
jgi:hypothetical protein